MDKDSVKGILGNALQLRQPQLSLQQRMLQQFAQAGLVARLRSDQPVDLLLEIGDALLASPVLVVELSMQHLEAAAAITAFAERFGDHLLVGGGEISTVQQGIAALGAGAQFLTTTRYTTELHQHAERCGALYIPPAATPAALPALSQMDVLLTTMSTQMLFTHYQTITTSPAIIAHDVTPESIGACRAAGATAIAVGNLLFPTTTWSMPAMIRTARYLRQLWMG